MLACTSSGLSQAAIIAHTSFEQAAPGAATGFSRAPGDTELEWSLTAGGVDDADDLVIISDAAGASEGQQFLMIRDSTTSLNGGNLALTFEDVMLPEVDLVTVSIDVAVGSGSWNTADFFSYAVNLGGVTHTIAEVIGSDLDLIENAGWITYTADLPTAGAVLLTENLFQFRGTHNGDDILVVNLRIEAELVDPPSPPTPPPVSGEVPEPSAMLMWSGLVALGLIPWLKRRWMPMHGQSD